MFQLGKTTYKLVRIGLVRAACPREVEHTRDNLNLGKAIRIDANEHKLGSVASVGFVPAGIIMAGAARRIRMMEGGFVYDYAFVDRTVRDIRCDDEISSNELMQKLDSALRDRIMGPARNDSCCAPGQISPWIIEIYPFENYFIYNLKGQKYRQGYVIDPVKREVRLGPGAQKVEEKFVTASGKDVSVKAGGPGSGRKPLVGQTAKAFGYKSVLTGENPLYIHPASKNAVTHYPSDNWTHKSNKGFGKTLGRGSGAESLHEHLTSFHGVRAVAASVDKMPLNQDGGRYAPTSTPGNNQTVSPGASHCDLITMLIRNWKNVIDAVDNYLAAIRNGQHKPVMRPPMFAPVSLTPAGKIGVAIASKGIDVFDFAQWSAAEQSKRLK